MFINLALDRIVLSVTEGSFILPFRDIDKNLPHELITLYKKYNPDTLYVLNGPWSFTHVRVGILAVETLHALTQKSFNILTIDKLSLFYKLHNEWFLPRYGIVYFGQRKNLGIVDCLHCSRELLPYTNILAHLENADADWSQKWSFFVDTFLNDDFEGFIDHPSAVSFTYCDWELMWQYLNKKTLISSYFTTDKLIPVYWVDVNIG